MHLSVLAFTYGLYIAIYSARVMVWANASGPDPQRPVVLLYCLDVLLFPLGMLGRSLIMDGTLLTMILGFGLIVLNSWLWGMCLKLIWDKWRPKPNAVS